MEGFSPNLTIYWIHHILKPKMINLFCEWLSYFTISPEWLIIKKELHLLSFYSCYSVVMRKHLSSLVELSYFLAVLSMFQSLKMTEKYWGFLSSPHDEDDNIVSFYGKRNVVSYILGSFVSLNIFSLLKYFFLSFY